MPINHWYFGPGNTPDDLTQEEQLGIQQDLDNRAIQDINRRAAMSELYGYATDVVAPPQGPRPVSVAAAGAMSPQQLEATQARRQQAAQFQQGIEARRQEARERIGGMTRLEQMREANAQRRAQADLNARMQLEQQKMQAPKFGELGDFVYRVDNEGKMQKWRVKPEDFIEVDGYFYRRNEKDPTQLEAVAHTPEAALQQSRIQAQIGTEEARRQASLASAGASAARQQATMAGIPLDQAKIQADIANIQARTAEKQIAIDHYNATGSFPGTGSQGEAAAVNDVRDFRLRQKAELEALVDLPVGDGENQIPQQEHDNYKRRLEAVDADLAALKVPVSANVGGRVRVFDLEKDDLLD